MKPNSATPPREMLQEPATKPVARTTTWSDVRAAIEALICVRTLQLDDGEVIEEPMFGPMGCEAPPATTAVGRAVARAYESADPILQAMRHAWADRAVTAMEAPAPERLEAVRRAFLDERFEGLLLAHLQPALADEELVCEDCPAAFVAEPRSVSWDAFVPYLAAYVWPDPVTTPRDARGRTTGEPEYGMHVCVGINGIDALPERDDALVELGFIATLHTEAVLERAPVLFAEIREDAAFRRLRDDAARTKWLRDHLGPRLFAEPEIRQAVCETVERFRPDTGIRIEGCDTATPAGQAR